MLGWIVLGLAWAGSGPWVPGSGQGNVYLGIDAQRFRTFSATIDGEREERNLGEGVQQLSGTGVLTYGVAPRAEVEVVVPVHAVFDSRPDDPSCTALGPDACADTRTVGVLRAHVKVLVTDEVAGAPLSTAVAGVVRFGALVAPFRDRLTNAGEGTLDAGARLSLGKAGSLSRGYWSMSTDATALYRVPHTHRFPSPDGDLVAPGSELHVNAESFFAPRTVFAIGPAATFLWRPQGVDFDRLIDDDEANGDVDRFAALRVSQLNVGAKLLFRDSRDNAFVVSVFRTVHATNNPNDQIGLSMGIVLNHLFRPQEG